MRKLKVTLFTLLFFVIMVLSFCEKEPADERDKFVGTWKGTFNVTIPDISVNVSDPVTYTISKDSGNPKQIFFDEAGSILGMTATVNGNAYTYDEYTEITTIEGITYSLRFNGGGSINGNVITELGIFRIYVLGEEYPGTWSSTLNKQ